MCILHTDCHLRIETFNIIINSIESEHGFALNYSIIFNDISLCNRPFDS